MKRAILTAVVLILAGALAASPQNTFCAANLACTVSALWTFSGGITSPSVGGTSSGLTYDISANTFKTSSNTAGHYPRNNGTQYVDNAIQAADLPATTSPCTGVQFERGLNAGGTSNCATPPTFVASGSSHAVGYVPDPGSSAGTTRFLREDATWVAQSSGTAVTAVDLTTQGANIGATTILTPGANGYYRITGYEVLTRQATVSSTVPSVAVSWTDPDSGVAQGPAFFLAVNSGNTLGGLSPCNSVGGACEIIFYAKSGVAIQYQTASYATSGATSMQFALHLRLEGPF